MATTGTHPLHRSHSGRNECDATAVSVSEQLCSNCQSLMFSLKPAFHCQLCNFVLCIVCDKGYQHPVHDQHKLYITNPLQGSSDSWRCDVCKKSSVDLGETHSYHCPTCNFNMCKNCTLFILRPLHAHCLIRTDVRNVYHQSSGDWRCDACGCNNGPENYYPWHCKTCRYDLCDNCCKPWQSLLHPNHQLYKADSNLVYRRFNGGWRCDQCYQSFTSENNKQPYHCEQCEFDLCEDCLRADDGNIYNYNVGHVVPRAIGMESSHEVADLTHTTTKGNPIACPVEDTEEQIGRPGPSVDNAVAVFGMMLPKTTKGNPIACPVEEMEEQIGRPAPSVDNAGECVICLDKPKDATIVHGNTGHVCCCTGCATELQKKGLNCPMCGAHIDRVINVYV